jgi:hypothetical protein
MKHLDEKRGRLPNKVLWGIGSLCLILLMLSACAGSAEKNNLELEKNFSGLTDQNLEWLENVNSDSPLNAYYHPFAVMLSENEWFLTREEMENQLHTMDIKKRTILGVYQQSSIQLFEIGDYILADSSELTYLTAYTKYNDQWLRQLEVLYKKADSSLDVEQIDDMKSDIEQNWAEAIASRDADQMVEALFWEDARYLYLPNGRYTHDYEELLEAYRSVELPGLQFSVRVQDLYVVRDDVIYILGQYQVGTNQGNYALIHTKNEQDTWKNMLDTNY